MAFIGSTRPPLHIGASRTVEYPSGSSSAEFLIASTGLPVPYFSLWISPCAVTWRRDLNEFCWSSGPMPCSRCCLTRFWVFKSRAVECLQWHFPRKGSSLRFSSCSSCLTTAYSQIWIWLVAVPPSFEGRVTVMRVATIFQDRFAMFWLLRQEYQHGELRPIQPPATKSPRIRSHY
jgi:hypothetical protein